MFREGRERIAAFLKNGKNRRIILLVVAVSVLLSGVAIGKEHMRSKGFVQDEKGEIVSVEKRRAKDTEVFTLHVKVCREGVTAERDVTLTLRGERQKKSSPVDRSDPAAKLDRELEGAISEAEEGKGKYIELPLALQDGTRIRWSKSNQSAPIMFLLFPVGIIPLLYLSDQKKDREVWRMRTESVRRSLPVFTDQVMILLSCGLILSDAFNRIAEGYRTDPTKNSFFERLIVDCQECAARTNRSLVTILNEKADQYRIREFTRIVGYISENQYRGVDLSGKLEASGRELWEARKKQAEEKGRMAETKLTMPLAVLLLVLILVTAAPAILQVKGGT